VRDQRRDPPQRRLLLGEPGEPGAGLGIRDRRRHQIGELGQPRLCVRRHRFFQAPAGGHHAPETPLDCDWRPNRRADASFAGRRTDRPGGVVIALDPDRPTSLRNQGGGVLPAKCQPGTDGEDEAGLSPGGEEGDRPVRLAAAQVREFDRKEPPDLLDNRREHLLRGHRARDQRRHAPQRRLIRD
jgi:hypothetical protein